MLRLDKIRFWKAYIKSPLTSAPIKAPAVANTSASTKIARNTNRLEAPILRSRPISLFLSLATIEDTVATNGTVTIVTDIAVNWSDPIIPASWSVIFFAR